MTRSLFAAVFSAVISSSSFAATQNRATLGLVAEERFDSGANQGNSDILSRIGPNISLVSASELGRIESRYALEFVQHIRAKENGVDHNASLEFDRKLSHRLSLEGEGVLFRVEDMVSLPRLGVARISAPAIWCNWKLKSYYALNHVSSLALGYKGDATRIYIAGNDLGIAHDAWAELRQIISLRSELGIRYRLQLFTSGNSLYSNGHSLGLSYRFNTSRHSFFIIEAGPLLYHRFSDDSKWIARGSAEFGYDARGVYLGIVAGREILGAVGYAAAIWSNYLQAAAIWRMSDRWRGWAGGGYYRNGAAPSGAAEADGVSASVGIERIFSDFSVAATYDYMEQLGLNGANFGLARNIASIRLTYGGISSRVPHARAP